ncbi:hypothetical protein tb265_06900 [Gemmatimonadetes bacterium T265]|nr:hypothetical protein tb265_06900 [Gemmatimonadetes bacterium T265]
MAAAVYAAPAPVVLADTCALLNVVRAPLRSAGAAAASGALALAGRLADPRTAWLVVADVVCDEWARDVGAAAAEVAHAVREAERVTAGLAAAAAIVAPGPGVAPFRAGALGLERRLHALTTRLIADARVFGADDDGCMQRAYRRAVVKHAPAARGKPEAADCLIVEHYLEFARQLRGGGCDLPICFASSNTADYGRAAPGGASSAMRDPLPAQFAVLNLTFATDLAWAERLASPP